MIRSHKGSVTKLFKTTITCNNDRVDTTKATRPTNPSNLISTLLFQLESWKCQLHPRFPGRVCHTIDRDTASVAREGERGHDPEGGYGNIEKYPEWVTTSVTCKGDTTKSGYLTFDPGGISTIYLRPTWGQVSESSRSPRGKTSSYPSKKPMVSSIIPMTEDYYKILSHTLILGYSQTTRGPKTQNQTDISYVNLKEY